MTKRAAVTGAAMRRGSFRGRLAPLQRSMPAPSPRSIARLDRASGSENGLPHPESPMRFSEPLLEGRLIERYKRFLADVLLADGSVVTAHCANPGAMLGLKEPGSRVLLSRATIPSASSRITGSSSRSRRAAGRGSSSASIRRARMPWWPRHCARDRLAPFVGYERIRPEVKYGRNSRVDFLLEKDGAPPCYLEVKNCHLMREPGLRGVSRLHRGPQRQAPLRTRRHGAGRRAGGAGLCDPDGGRTASTWPATSTPPTTRRSDTRWRQAWNRTPICAA